MANRSNSRSGRASAAVVTSPSGAPMTKGLDAQYSDTVMYAPDYSGVKGATADPRYSRSAEYTLTPVGQDCTAERFVSIATLNTLPVFAGMLRAAGFALDPYAAAAIRQIEQGNVAVRDSLIASIAAILRGEGGHEIIDQDSGRRIFAFSNAAQAMIYDTAVTFCRQNPLLLGAPSVMTSRITGKPAGYVAPAGSLTSGVPAATYPAGSYQFRTAIRVLGVEPMIDAGAFRSTLARTVSEIMPGAVTVQSAAIYKGAKESESLPASTYTAMIARLAATALLGPIGALAAETGIVAGNAARARGAFAPSAWWVSITGQITSPAQWSLNGSASLNRAIARAVAQVTRFGGEVDPRYRGVIPTDGGTLDNQFRTGSACSGGFTPTQVYAKACTRVESVAPVTSVPAPYPTARPPAPTPTPGGTSTALPSGPGAGQSCAVRIAAVMYLRNTPTFSRTNAAGRNFPSYPAGTAVTITGPAQGTQGTLRLFPVSVAGTPGYGALAASDMVGCTVFQPGAPVSTGGGSSGGGTSAPPTPNQVVVRPPLAPLAVRPPAAPLTNALTSTDNTSMYVYGALAFLATGALAAVIIKRDEIFGTGKRPATHHKSNKRRHARRRRSGRRSGR